MSASIVVDAVEAVRLIQRVQAKVADVDPLLDSFGDILESRIELNFRDQVDYKGTALQQLSALTIARRRKGNGSGSVQILRDTGRLQNTLRHEVSAGALLLSLGGGPANRSAAVHQFGSTAKNIPRRAVMPIDEAGNADLSADDLLELADLAAEYILDAA